MTLGDAIDGALHNHVKFIFAGIGGQCCHAFNHSVAATKRAANDVLMKRHNLFFAAIRHADQHAIIANHPDHAVRFLLIRELNDAASGDVLGQDGNIRRLICVNINVANIFEFAYLARSALQKQRHICNLNRFCVRCAVVRVFADQRCCRRDRAIVGGGNNILTARRAYGQHAGGR